MVTREPDAVCDIDKTTGNIIWKVGGTPTPGSLTVVGSGVTGSRHWRKGSGPERGGGTLLDGT